jgi:ribosomal protein L40E
MVPEAEAGQEKETVCSAFDRLCDEEPEHYVERYITEPEYKAWFDRNFSDYTIYEGIGITELQYQEIVNNLTKPQPAAEQKTVTAQESSGGLVYVLVAVVAVGGVIGAVFFIKKGSKASDVQRESPSRRQTTVLFCGNCGNSLKPEAKFCGKCGSAQS